MALVFKNTKDIGKDPEIRKPWPDNWVDWFEEFDEKLLNEFEKLIETSNDERPLQTFLAANPRILALALHPHACWIFDHPRLGNGKHIPDFLYIDKNSLGFKYVLVELESPTANALNKDESLTKDMNHAIQQIQDYRGWLRDNALFEREKFPEISARCEGYIVIGRRKDDYGPDGKRRLADYRDVHIDIASYDRLLHEAREHYRFQHSGRAKEIMEAAKANPDGEQKAKPV